MTTPFWLDDPTTLLRHDNITKIWPTSNMDSNDKLNAITRLVALLTILGYLLSKQINIVITGVVTLLAIIVLKYAQLYSGDKQEKKEGFTTELQSDNLQPTMLHNTDLPPNVSLNSKIFTQPKPSNPIMNVLPTQIQDDPKRKPAAPAYNPEVEKKINKATKAFIAGNFNCMSRKDVDEKLFKDLGDSYVFDRSMRQWYSTANTQIPNDQKGFAEFCYGDISSCKEDSVIACTRGMPHRWK